MAFGERSCHPCPRHTPHPCALSEPQSRGVLPAQTLKRCLFRDKRTFLESGEGASRQPESLTCCEPPRVTWVMRGHCEHTWRPREGAQSPLPGAPPSSPIPALSPRHTRVSDPEQIPKSRSTQRTRINKRGLSRPECSFESFTFSHHLPASQFSPSWFGDIKGSPAMWRRGFAFL